MAFTLDKLMGKGNAQIKVTADANSSGDRVVKQLLVQVNGVTKQVIQLVQAAAQNYKVYIETSLKRIPQEGCELEIVYWATLNGEIVDDEPDLGGFQYDGSDVINYRNGEGKWVYIDNIHPNVSEKELTLEYTVEYKGAKATAVVIQEKSTPLTVAELHAEIYPTEISADGGNFSITFWEVMSDGSISIGNLAMVKNPSLPNYVTLGSAIRDSSGKYVASGSIIKNTSTVARSITVCSIRDTKNNKSVDVTLVQKAAEVTIHYDVGIKVDSSLFQSTGGEVKVSFWAKEGGSTITDGVELEVVSTEDQLTYTYINAGTDSDGKYQKIKIGQNSTNKSRYLSLRAKYQGVYSDVIRITQLPSEAFMGAGSSGEGEGTASNGDVTVFIYEEYPQVSAKAGGTKVIYGAIEDITYVNPMDGELILKVEEGSEFCSATPQNSSIGDGIDDWGRIGLVTFSENISGRVRTAKISCTYKDVKAYTLISQLST